jgi:quercetin dioxygenase-like cupin family protein
MKLEKSSNIKKSPVTVEGAKDTQIRVLISKQDGAENFAMRLFELQPGGHTPLHTHPHEHEVFIVAGHGTLVCQGQVYLFGSEDCIFIPGGEEHQFKNTGDAVLKFLCLIPAYAA